MRINSGRSTSYQASHALPSPVRWRPGRRLIAVFAVVLATLGMVVATSSPASAAATSYPDTVRADGASHLWRLGEASGTTGYDSIGSTNLNERTGVVHGAPGAIIGDADTATDFAGNSSSSAYDPEYLYAPNNYTLAAWFKTTTTVGGKIIGFGSTPGGGTNGSYDRHVYMGNDGRLNYGVYTYTVTDNVITTPKAYNDGQWHQVVATLSGAGMTFYVDGHLIGTRPSITSGENQYGYWNIGGDSVAYWKNAPSSNFFRGTIDEVALFPTAIDGAAVRGEFAASGRNAPPAAAIGNPTCTGLACSFDGTSSSDVDGNVASYSWDFGDGSTSSAASPSHTYATDGTYTVSLAVTDDQGAVSDTVTRTVAVTNAAPTAVIASPSCSYLTCRFDGSSSSDSDGSIASYSWDFGDGSTSTDAKPTHTYAQAGSYAVTLTVTDNSGADSAPASTSVDTKADQAPTAVIASPSCSYLTCRFDGSSSSDSDGSIASYSWDFGDGSTSTDAKPSHTYAQAGNYTVTLTVTDDQNQSSDPATTSVSAVANQAPTATISFAGCGYLHCEFDGSTSSDPDGSVDSYAWNFGDGSTGTGAKPAHTYADEGTYRVSLVVTDDQGLASGSTDADHTTITTYRAPIARSAQPSCTELTCSFDGSASTQHDNLPASSYTWDFGDGTTGTGATPSHTYATDGTYTASLDVTDDLGQPSRNDASQTVTVKADQAPVATISQSGCHYLSCAFDGSTSTDPDGSVASYRWTFGDGSSSTVAKPTHRYSRPGTYPVTLVVTDNQGKTDQTSVSVGVKGDKAPVAVLAAPSCSYLTCTYDGSGSTDSDGTVDFYEWTFGDGTTASGPMPTHTYAAAGNYKVTLVVTDDNDTDSDPATRTFTVKANVKPTAAFTGSCTYLNCAFDGSTSKDSDGTVASYAWDFGDGTTGTGQQPSHSYAKAGSYKVTLVVTDNAGADSTAVSKSFAAKANAKPTAAFTGSCTYLACAFDGSTSKDSDGTIASYAWDFGDGTSATGVKPSHTYAANGTYKVTLVVTDDGGAASTAVSKTFAVKANVKPTASFTNSCTGRVCSFDGTSSKDTDGTIASYSWAFGDGGVDTSATPSHTYAKPGKYTVSLTVTDDGGATATKQLTITVTAPNQPPTASFTASAPGLTATFDAHNSSDNDGTITSYVWNFGDGTTGTGLSPKHTYVGPGSYAVVLTVTDNGGLKATANSTLTVVRSSSKLLVSDYYDRSVTDGWGSPTVGGAYSLGSAANRFSVDGATGNLLVPKNEFVSAFPAPLQTLNSEQVLDVTVPNPLPANGVYVWLTARRTVGAGYLDRLFISGSGSVTMALCTTDGTNGQVVLQSTLVSGLTATPGATLRMRYTVSGSGTTSLTGKVWDASKAEPTDPQLSVTNSTPGDLQKAAGFGITATTNGTNATASTVVKFDNLLITSP